jgi:hypothetical protein
MIRVGRARAALLALALAFLALLSPRSAVAAPAESLPPDVTFAVQTSTLRMPALPAGWKVNDRGWLRVAYPESVEARMFEALDDIEGFKATLVEALGVAVLDRPVEVRVARTADGMAELAPPELPPLGFATAVTYPAVRLVVLSLQERGTHEGTRVGEVLRHELVHVAVDDATAGHHVPLWFNEGLAIHFSGENVWERRETLWHAAVSGTLLPLSDIDEHYPRERGAVNLAYAEAADFTRHLLRGEDHDRFTSLVARVRGGAPFERALSDAYGENLRTLEYEWHEELSRKFSVWPLLGGGSLWIVGTVALIAAWVRRRRRAKAKLAQWEREELEEERASRARSEAIAAMEDEADGPILRAPVPVVRHEGHWHTLH